ncbi:MAG TPA: 50S ribosomal protein L10 [Gaiellaceae bacterium]
MRKDKERVVAELVDRLRSSDTLIVADYRGLSMSEIDGVRTELLKHGARFTVVKNTLTKRAAEEAGIKELTELLDGPTAIAFVGDGDMVAVAKSLQDTARQTRILTVKGGILEGQPVSAEQVRDLASLPPVNVLQGQILGAVVGPLNAIVGLFTAPLRDLVGVIDARITQLQEQGETAEPAEPEAEAQPEAAEESQPGAEAEAETAEPEGEEQEASEPDEKKEEESKNGD